MRYVNERRRRRLTGSGILAAGVVGAVGVSAQPASAASTVRALWHMGETSGTVMTDSSGHGNNGTLYDVRLGLAGQSGSAYGFNGTSSIVKVPSASSLNPGSAPFTWTMHVKMTRLPSDDYDLLRKGLAATSGGYYKAEIMSSGRAHCEMGGSSGVAKITAGPNLANGVWHTVTCTRNGSTLTLKVDSASYSTTHSTGTVSNSAQLTVGAKSSGGDWYNGVMDEVVVVGG